MLHRGPFLEVFIKFLCPAFYRLSENYAGLLRIASCRENLFQIIDEENRKRKKCSGSCQVFLILAFQRVVQPVLVSIKTRCLYFKIAGFCGGCGSFFSKAGCHILFMEYLSGDKNIR